MVKKRRQLNVSRSVTVRRLPSSKGIRSFIEKRLQGWFYRTYSEVDSPEANGAPAPPATLPSFHVMFERHGDGHMVSCWVEVRVAGQIWRSSRIGPGIQQAFIQALQHLVPIRAHA
jgi:hypothetical protein